MKVLDNYLLMRDPSRRFCPALLSIHGFVNGMLASGKNPSEIWVSLDELLKLEDAIDRKLEKVRPASNEPTLPTIHLDEDLTNGELNPMVNDEPPMDVKDIPF